MLENYVEALQLHSEPALSGLVIINYCMQTKKLMKIIITDTNCNSANKNSVQLLALFYPHSKGRLPPTEDI